MDANLIRVGQDRVARLLRINDTATRFTIVWGWSWELEETVRDCRALDDYEAGRLTLMARLYHTLNDLNADELAAFARLLREEGLAIDGGQQPVVHHILVAMQVLRDGAVGPPQPDLNLEQHAGLEDDDLDADDDDQMDLEEDEEDVVDPQDPMARGQVVEIITHQNGQDGARYLVIWGNTEVDVATLANDRALRNLVLDHLEDRFQRRLVRPRNQTIMQQVETLLQEYRLVFPQ